MRRLMTNGYGVCRDDLNGIKARKVFELIKAAPNFEKEFPEFLKESEVVAENITIDDLEEIEIESHYGCHNGIIAILREVIEEAEGIRLVIARNYDGVQYLLFCPVYPWTFLTEAEMGLTEEHMEEIFRKYIGVLTSEPFDIDYYSVKNGG